MTQNSDEDRLAELGYAQELKRGLGLLVRLEPACRFLKNQLTVPSSSVLQQNFGVSLSVLSPLCVSGFKLTYLFVFSSIISIVTGCTTLFQTGLTTGGPAVRSSSASSGNFTQHRSDHLTFFFSSSQLHLFHLSSAGHDFRSVQAGQQLPCRCDPEADPQRPSLISNAYRLDRRHLFQ